MKPRSIHFEIWYAVPDTMSLKLILLPAICEFIFLLTLSHYVPTGFLFILPAWLICYYNVCKNYCRSRQFQKKKLKKRQKSLRNVRILSQNRSRNPPLSLTKLSIAETNEQKMNETNKVEPFWVYFTNSL